MALALMTMLAGCDEKKDVAAPAATTTVALTPTLAKVVASTPSGTAAAPSGESAKPSGESVGPSGAAAKPSGATFKAPAPTGFMPHGSVENGTLKYNPPPSQNPPMKKGAARP